MRRLLVLILGAGLLCTEAPLVAQTADSARAARHPLFTTSDLYYAGGFALATIVLTPLDRTFAHDLQDSTVQANRFFKNASTGFEVMARPGSVIIGGTLYAVGRLSGNERMADLGLHGTEAIVVADLLTRGIKGVVGRARPFVDVNNPRDFGLGRGIGDDTYQSFPSGHTTAAFAAAAAVTSETAEWWPEWRWVIGPVMYGGATLVGLSRMYHNKHWASDVVVGAAIGTFGGLKVVRYNHARPNNRLDRLLLGTRPGPDGESQTLLIFRIPLN